MNPLRRTLYRVALLLFLLLLLIAGAQAAFAANQCGNSRVALASPSHLVAGHSSRITVVVHAITKPLPHAWILLLSNQGRFTRSSYPWLPGTWNAVSLASEPIKPQGCDLEELRFTPSRTGRAVIIVQVYSRPYDLSSLIGTAQIDVRVS